MPKKRNPEETREKILDTSLELFRTKGYEKTTILDIVEAMDASRGAFYHHFKAKEEVLYAIFERKEEAYTQLCNNFLNDNNLTGIEKLRKMFTRCTELFFMGEDAKLISALLTLMEDPKMLAEQIKAIQKTQWLKPMIEQGIADGSIGQNDPQVLAELIMLLLDIWILPTIFPGNKDYIHAKIFMIKKILDGLGCVLLDDEFFELLTKIIENFGKENWWK